MLNLYPFVRKKNNIISFILPPSPPKVKFEGTNYIIDDFTNPERRKECNDARFTDELIEILNQDRVDGILGG